MKGICGNIVSNDVNLSEIIAITETLVWVRNNQWSKCPILSDSLVVVNNINGNTRMKDHI